MFVALPVCDFILQQYAQEARHTHTFLVFSESYAYIVI